MMPDDFASTSDRVKGKVTGVQPMRWGKPHTAGNLRVVPYKNNIFARIALLKRVKYSIDLS